MKFLADFDNLMGTGKEEAANALLFEWMDLRRGELFKTLQERRPVLRFWSRHPGNPDIPEERGRPGYAYLLTKQNDVKNALAQFSMKPYHRSGLFVLSVDDVHDHARGRQTLRRALTDYNYIEKIDAAVAESWAEIVPQSTDAGAREPVTLDVRAFARMVALRFTGKYFGLPEDSIFLSPCAGPDAPNLERWSEQAYENFIWKIHARHFVEDEPDMDGALGKIGSLVGSVIQNGPQPNTVIGRLANDTGHFSDIGIIINIVGSIQALIDNVMTAGCYALSELFRNERVEIAKSAVVKEDFLTLKKMIREAHRLDAPSPYLPRRASGEASLFTNRALQSSTPFANDVHIACAIGAAMNDPDYVENPEAFDADRKDAWDIRLGHGPHHCMGTIMGDEIVARTIAKVLELDGLEVSVPLTKRWGWLVEKFEVNGELIVEASRES